MKIIFSTNRSLLRSFISSLFLTTALFLVPRLSWALFDIYVGFAPGSSLMKETVSSEEYTHQNTFFVGHWSFELGTRLKFNLGPIGVGAIGELSWVGDSTDRKLGGAGDGGTYRNEFQRTIAGASVSINTGVSSIILEYYPYVQNFVSYSDEKSINPLKKNDKMSGTGFGAGFLFGFNPGMAYQMIYRNLSYNRFSQNGTDVSLPNDLYTALRVDEIMIGYVIKF